ncbi:SpoIIE family protein phosphatase [Thermoflexibacter ruber]|uniref:Serine phosphatase RsbU, regulator of sigma subunit n=1 Tax=Thermoflexibacter ruber TaxID=1003 RepID=A0A1I2IZ63_9BACT|nr:SpoIIE family protein phosphatase [Thermoflexibacter ruber]SFF45966.1 Serine phosphatase RsbU, regulator of sigma subunit [Thermoflexibacter ruber]
MDTHIQIAAENLVMAYLKHDTSQENTDFHSWSETFMHFFNQYFGNAYFYLFSVNSKKEHLTVEYTNQPHCEFKTISYKNDDILSYLSKDTPSFFALPSTSNLLNTCTANLNSLRAGIFFPLYEKNSLVGVLCIFSDILFADNQIKILYPLINHSFLRTYQLHQLKKEISKLESMNRALEASQEAMHENAINFIKIHKKLTDSLAYAKRIQHAILPSTQLLDNIFNEHFIIYLPKDIVSGDFYWCSQVDYTFLAVVDCTGHGVPGAFMSMIGHTLLNEIINTKRQTDPATILKLLHKGIKEVLKQEESNNKDGMDISLCRLERNANFQLKLTFAGAKSTLFIYQNGTLTKINGNRKNIGGIHYKEQMDFDNQEFDLQDGAILYLMTDGFVDTANQERARIGMEKFQNLLKEFANLPLTLQKEKLLQYLSDYQGQEPQRDDITILAVRV